MKPGSSKAPVIAAVVFLATAGLWAQTPKESIVLPDLPAAAKEAPARQSGAFDPADYKLLTDYGSLLERKAHSDLDQHIAIYRHQYFVSVFIFWLNVCLVIVGVVMSYMHFRMDERIRRLYLGGGAVGSTARKPKESGATAKPAVALDAALVSEPPPAISPPAITEPPGAPPPDGSAVAEIDWVGLKIKSSVIGLIILFISLLYFYLYLVFVYPIK